MRHLRIFALLVLAAAASAQDKPKAELKSDVYRCVAGPREQCASDLWYADLVRLKALQAKYAAPKDMQDMMLGMQVRLQQQIPPGFTWDDAKKRFVEQKPTATVATQPPTAIPAPDVKK
jgi:hypothetical protein